MQVLLLTPEEDYPDEIGLVQQFFELGLQRLHLRKPAYTRKGYSNYLDKLGSQYHDRVVLHGHFDLLEQYDLDGIHFNTAMRHDAMLAARFAGYAKISASFHTWQEIEENTMPYRYVFISPVFDSISKKGHEAAVDLNGATALRKKFSAQGRICPQLVGLGGVSAENINVLAAHHFDGAAILGGVWNAPDPLLAFKHIIAAANI